MRPTPILGVVWRPFVAAGRALEPDFDWPLSRFFILFLLPEKPVEQPTPGSGLHGPVRRRLPLLDGPL